MNDPQVVRAAQGSVYRATGMRYSALHGELDKLSTLALRDLMRMIRDLQSKATSERNKRRRGQFW